MSTLDTAALWSATSLAFDEKKIGAAGLSVRQRKLLTLLSQPASVSQLAQTIALPDEEVQTALERFAKLGLAQSDAPAPFDPMQVRASKPAVVAEQPSRMPLFIGIGVAALALVAASTWLLRGGSASTVPTPSATSPAPTVQTPTATGPSDNADTTLPRSAAPAPSATAASAAAATAAARVAPTPTPAPAAAATVATKAAPATAPVTPAAANVAPTKNSATASTETAAAPAVAAPTPAQPVVAPAAAAPAAAAPAPVVAPPPAATVATASPAAAAPRPAPAASREIKLVSRVEPTFPRGIDADRGTVKARLQVDARGAVTAVEIVEANPPRVFDRTVRSALQQWRYEPTGEAFSTAAEISFTR